MNWAPELDWKRGNLLAMDPAVLTVQRSSVVLQNQETKILMRRVIASKTVHIALLLLLLVPTARAYADDPSPNLTKGEFAELIKTHDESLRMLLGLICGMSDEQWNFMQNADRWSVGECTEHIVRSNRARFDFALKAMKSPPDPEWFKRTKG